MHVHSPLTAYLWYKHAVRPLAATHDKMYCTVSFPRYFVIILCTTKEFKTDVEAYNIMHCIITARSIPAVAIMHSQTCDAGQACTVLTDAVYST